MPACELQRNLPAGMMRNPSRTLRIRPLPGGIIAGGLLLGAWVCLQFGALMAAEGLIGCFAFLGYWMLALPSAELAPGALHKEPAEAAAPALSASEYRYRSVVTNLREVVFQTDCDGKWIFLNPAWTEITGREIDDSLGKHFAENIHPEDRPRAMAEFEGLMGRRKDDCRYEIRYKNRNGLVRLIEVYAQPSLDEHNKLTGTTGTLTDITKRKEAEEALRLNQERLQLALGSAEQGLWDWDLGTNRAYYDDHWAELLGYQPEEIEQTIETWKRAIHPYDLNFVEAGLATHHEGKSMIFDVEYRAQRKQGDWVWFNARGRVIERDAQGQPLRMIGTLENINRRKEAAADIQMANKQLGQQNAALREIGEKLRKQEAESRMLAHVVSRTDNAVTLYDQSGRIVWINRAFQATTGYSLEEAAGKKPFELLHGPETDPDTRQYMQEQLKKGKGYSVELINYNKAGHTYWASVEVQPILDDQGVLANFMALSRDITERKCFEKELERAKETAEAANHAKSDFLAVMSHEIRTPMNGVIGFTNILLDTKLNVHQRDFVENIQSCADSLLSLINNILDFSKIESAHLELECEPFDLRKCMEDAINVSAQTASAKGVELVCDLGNDVPAWVRGDVTRLRQVMVNLVGNAVKFTLEGEVVLTVESARDDARLGALKFSLRDTGIGIGQDRLSRLFKPFSQADSSTTRRFGGTGLGLAICKRLVELMGGEIQIESAPQAGSTFHFTIALPPAGAPLDWEETHLDGNRVLIVDDNSANRRALRRQMLRWGLKPVEAAKPEEALSLLKAGEEFDFGLLDMQMPGMDGIELAGRIRTAADAKKLPLILLSPIGAAESSLQARAAGIQTVLNKPARQSHLYDAILRLLWDSGRIGKPASKPTGTSNGTLAVKLGEDFPLRILLAEDFPVNQRIAILMLKKIGYTADIVPTGNAAVEAVFQSRYDLVLMDMHMPEMDGLEATREIRRLEAERKMENGVYIIALTADAMAGDREKCLASGMNDYLSKPLRPDKLEAALKRFVQA